MGSAELREESPIITEHEAAKLLHDWNSTHVDYPRDKCVHQLFEEQVERTPDSIAVIYEGDHATYAELNAGANRLANYLIKQGVKEETIVAVFLERGIEMLTGLLAISKVGATYLPLDPIYPKVRIEMVLNDARPLVCLTQKSLTDHLPQSATKFILIDEKEKYVTESADNLSYGKPLTPLYIIFTSGSTGKPKGVPVTQRSTVNLINCFTRLLQVTSKDIVLMVTTITFDIAESDIYLALLNGGKLVIATRETSMNMELLKEKLETSHATIFEATPITHKMLIQAGWKGKKDLKLVSGGDEMSRELGSELVKRVKEVFNVYGPTETTIYNTFKKVIPGDANGEGCVPLGRPVDNNQLYILDTEMKLVPVGVSGELYIGGDGLSPGYLNNAEMTASRFVKNPFSEKPDDLIFKSGDLVKYLPDSTIVFLARIDTQVKIRGFRIELGEIESAICSFPGIKEAIVVAPNNPCGDKVLVAYYTLESSEDIDLEKLRSLLKLKLPDYQVPSFFLKLDKIPLTLTNKVDRRTLTAAGLPSVVDDSNFIAPSTEYEIRLAKIWKDILKIDKISIHSGFFELGGYSLLAVSMIIRIEKEFGIRLPLTTIVEQSTIQKLSKIIEEGITPDKWRSLVPLRPNGEKKPLFLIHGMGLNVLLYTTIINYLDPNQPVYGLQAKGLNGVEKPLETIEDIASYYISEIMTIDNKGPYQLAGYSLGGNIAFEMARQLDVMGKKVSFIGLLDTDTDNLINPFSISGIRYCGGKYSLNYLKWNILYLFKHSNESMFAVIRRRLNGLWKKIRGRDYKVVKENNVSKGEKRELPKYLRKVHQANLKASRNYIIKPYSGCVHVFKATHQTFYIHDPVNYGWDKYALGGAVIHEIPGEHSVIFAPPNDKYFSSILQQSLDESMIQSWTEKVS